MGDAMYLVRGLLIGMIFGVPAGVIGIMTIQRTLEHGFLAGVATGFGSMAADLVYGCIGVCGLTAVSDMLLSWEWLIRLLGGILIAAFGVMTFRKVAASQAAVSIEVPAHKKGRSRRRSPARLQQYPLLFASFGILGGVTIGQGCYLLWGLALGTGCWWIFLAGLISVFRRKISGRIYGALNKILGGLMVVFGVGAAARGFL